jgi:uncharacterized membrane protein YidH (DUF202 family)
MSLQGHSSFSKGPNTLLKSAVRRVNHTFSKRDSFQKSIFDIDVPTIKDKQNNVPYTLAERGDFIRSFMANVRNYFAYLRTAITFVSFGFGLSQFVRNRNDSYNLWASLSGAGIILFGMGILGWGSWRYYKSNDDIVRNTYTVDTIGPLVLLVMGLLAGCILIILMFII